MNTQTIDRELNQKILSQINWRHGILPTGMIAKDPCFNLREMPIIKTFIIEPSSPQELQNPTAIPSATATSTQPHHRSILVTQSEWTYNLVHSGAIYNLHDDATLQALSDCQLIFHQIEKPYQKTLHVLHYETIAWFRVDDIFQTTQKFENALKDALACWPEDPEKAWHKLCRNVWLVYGFLWPQKLMLGHRQHVKQVYKATTVEEGKTVEEGNEEQHYRQVHADQVASLQMNKIINHPQEGHGQIVWDIIKRSDIRPLHEFLPKEQRDTIVDIISMFVHRIPVHHPIKLKSPCTSGYLGWRQVAKKGKSTSSPSFSLGRTNNNSNINKNSFRFATIPLQYMSINRSYYLWQFEWTSLDSLTTRKKQEKRKVEAIYEPTFLRCTSRVYLYPILNESTITMHRSLSGVTQQSAMALTRRSVPITPSHNAQEKIRALELMDVTNKDHDHKHQWTIELPGLELERDDDISTDMGRNVDLEIGRRKPIVHGDIITLRQVHYLCSSPRKVDNTTNSTFSTSSASPSSPSSPSIRPTPPLPPSIAPYLLPRVTADISPLSNSSTSVPSNVSSPLQHSGSTTNTSITFNHSPPSRFSTFLPSFATNNNNHSHSSQDDHMHIVLAKELDVIGKDTIEQLWVIERAMPEDMQYHPTSTISTGTATVAMKHSNMNTTIIDQPQPQPYRSTPIIGTNSILAASSSAEEPDIPKSNNVIRRRKSILDLKISRDISNLRKKKSFHNFRSSREQNERDAVNQVQAIINNNSLDSSHQQGRSTPIAERKVQSLTDLTDLGYGLERQNTMEDIDTSGSLSFQPPGSSSIQQTPPRQYNEEDLDVCPTVRGSHLIELYASRQQRKRVSHLLKAGTLSGFGIGKKK